MRRIRTLGPLAALMVVLAAPACRAGEPSPPRAIDPPARAVLSGSLAPLHLALLPPRDGQGGVFTADRPNPSPTAVGGLLAAVLTAGGRRRQQPVLAASPPARRPGHQAAGGPRAPPSIPRPS
jgi:hypothetical protein